jgi:hypothetical protein
MQINPDNTITVWSVVGAGAPLALPTTSLTGTVPATAIPAPTTSTIGGVQSKAAVANQFLTQIGTDGSVSQAQPAFSNISGVLAAAQRPALLNQQYATATLTGNSTDQTILTFTVLGGTLAAGRGIRVTLRFLNVGATSTLYKAFFGGTALFTYTDTNANNHEVQFMVFNQLGSTTAQVTMPGFHTFGASVTAPGTITDSAVNTAIDQIVKFTFNVANTVTITKYTWVIELL